MHNARLKVVIILCHTCVYTVGIHDNIEACSHNTQAKEGEKKHAGVCVCVDKWSNKWFTVAIQTHLQL